MISVQVSVGSGNKKMPDIEDDLIIDNTMAVQRGKQELAASTYIIKSETLDMPHEPNGVVGVIGSEFSFSTLEIFGRYFITSLVVSLNSDGARDTVVAERYGKLLL